MTLPDISPDRKILVLGTALWGWGVDRPTAYRILERYLELGNCIVDTAVNYPINKRREDFGLAATWLADWIAANGTNRLSVLVKVGALDNMGSPHVDLRASSLLNSVDYFRGRFDMALSAVAIHWDDRGDGEGSREAIEETISIMADLEASGLSIGFSGVKRPDLYLNAGPRLCDKWWIQVKENLLTSTARQEYEKYFPKARYLAYGINMGGLKREPPSENSSILMRGINRSDAFAKRLSIFLDSENDLEPRPTTFNELALAISHLNPALNGIIIGPRNAEQLDNSISYWSRLRQKMELHGYSELIQKILHSNEYFDFSGTKK